MTDKDLTKKDQINNSSNVVMTPTYLIMLSILKELHRIGILSENELKNICIEGYKAMELCELEKEYHLETLLLPITMMADKEFREKFIKDFKNGR